MRAPFGRSYLFVRERAHEIANPSDQIRCAVQFSDLVDNGATDNSGIGETPDFFDLFVSRNAKANRHRKIADGANPPDKFFCVACEGAARAGNARPGDSVDESARLLGDARESVIRCRRGDQKNRIEIVLIKSLNP